MVMNPHIGARKLHVLLANVAIATAVFASPSFALNDPIGLPTTMDQSMWYRFFVAGEQCMIKGSPDSARRYWSAALSALESNPRPINSQDIFFSVKLSALEQCYTESFPRDFSRYNTGEQELHERMEQVEALRRMANLNARLISPRDRLVWRSRDRYKAALSSLQSAMRKNQQSRSALALNSDGGDNSPQAENSPQNKNERPVYVRRYSWPR